MAPPGRLLTMGGFLLALAVASCGDVNAGSQPFAGTVQYEDAAGAFALRLLEPPWLPPLSSTGQTVFVVPPSDATVSTNLTVVLAEALYSLAVQRSNGAPLAAMRSIKAALPLTAMAVQQPIVTASGATGYELSWLESASVFHRDAFLAGATTSTFQLHFTARHAIDADAMVTQMIVSFDPR